MSDHSVASFFFFFYLKDSKLICHILKATRNHMPQNNRWLQGDNCKFSTLGQKISVPITQYFKKVSAPGEEDPHLVILL